MGVFSLIFIEIMLETIFELFSIIRNQEGGCVRWCCCFCLDFNSFLSVFFFRFLKFFFYDCYCFYLMAQKFQKCFLMDVVYNLVEFIPYQNFLSLVVFLPLLVCNGKQPKNLCL